jgi:hypothetical protein
MVTNMRAVVLRAGLCATLACVLRVPLAHADIYTWLDATGRVNVSNLAPPAGTRVTSVVRERPASAAEIAAREARQRADVAALEEQVRSLQAEVEATRQPRVAEQPAAPIVYNIITVSPPPAAVADLAAAPVVYANASPALAYGCPPAWAGCATWWPGFATSTVVVGAGRTRFHPFVHGRRFHTPAPHVRGPFDWPSSLPATTGVPMRR